MRKQGSQALLVDSDWAYALWLPHPHQNLGVLERRVGARAGLRVAVEEILDLASLELPTFGPFRIPPAHEMTLVCDEQARELELSLSMYPAIRWLLRAAGLVARNPWLAGGEIQLGDRRVAVEWRRGIWHATTGRVTLEPAERVAATEPVLALLRLGRPAGGIPAGLFRLNSHEHHLRLTSLSSEKAKRFEKRLDPVSTEVALLWTRLAPRSETAGTRALLVLSELPGDVQGVPAVVVAQRGPGPRWRLPGEGLIEFVGEGVQELVADGWSLAAYDRGSLTAAQALLPELDAFYSASRGVVRSAGDLDLVKARDQLAAVVQMLERIPVVGDLEAQRWLAVLHLLSTLESVDRLSIRVLETDELLMDIW